MKLGKLLSAGLGLAVSIGVLTIGGGQANAATDFSMPFPCGQVWEGQTRTGHSPANSVDLNRSADEGDAVVASAAGTVSKVGNTGGTSYGKWIEINHGGGWTTRYAHLSAQRVSVGQNVGKGASIGNVGNTGGSTGAHLHYEQRLNGVDQKIKWDGAQILYWGSKSYKSKNCGGGGGGGNPYTPEEICGDGYKVVDTAAVGTAGKAYLLYNNANGKNCVTTIKSTNLGKETAASSFLEVQGSARITDKGEYGYYAGPVRATAPGKCVKWGGTVGTASYTSGFEHCG